MIHRLCSASTVLSSRSSFHYVDDANMQALLKKMMVLVVVSLLFATKKNHWRSFERTVRRKLITTGRRNKAKKKFAQKASWELLGK